MKISFFIARRYLFAKKSRNIINVISLISLGVVAFVAAAMVIVMSAFSGLELLIEDLFDSFDAPITLVAKEGNTLPDSTIDYAAIQAIPGIETVGKVIEQDAWLQFNNANTVATVKAIEPQFLKTLSIDSLIYSGEFILQKDSFNFAVLGLGVRGELQIPSELLEPIYITVRTPVAGRRLSTQRENAFNETQVRVKGIFSSNAELDRKFFFLPFRLAQELYELDSACTAIEIQLAPNADVDEVKAALKTVAPNTVIETREEKNALVYKTNASEKWATFLILVFILILASFNILASLTLLIIEKKKDIYIMYAMGATRPMIKRIFIMEGVFINFLGAALGTVLGIGLCLLQQHFGLVRMQGAVVDFYPVHVEPSFVTIIFFTVLGIGSIFCLIFVPQLLKRFQYRRESTD